MIKTLTNHICNLSRKYNIFGCFVLLFIYCSVLQGQVMDLSFHHLSEENGLTHSDSYFVSKDSKGFVWIGTEKGLLRFDGLNLKKYQVQSDVPNSLIENVITSRCFEDRKGNLWFTSFGNINCYRRDSDDFISFSLSTNLKSYSGFYFDDKSTIWLRIGEGKDGALYFFNIEIQEFEQSIALEGKLCKTVKDKKGTVDQLLISDLSKPGMIWNDIGTGVKKHIEFLYTSTGVKRTFSSPTKKAFVDSEGIAWVGVYNGLGRYKLGDNEGVIEMERTAEISQDIEWVSDIVEYNEHYLLVASGKGLLLFDKQNRKFAQQFRDNPNVKYSLKLNEITNLYLDSTGDLWLSGAQQEIAFANLAKHKFPSIPEMTGSFVSTIKEDLQKNIWCSTIDSGTYVFNQNKDLLFKTKQYVSLTDPNDKSSLHNFDFFIAGEDEQWWGNLGNNLFSWNPATELFEFQRAYFLGLPTSSGRINYSFQHSSGKNLVAKGSQIYELKLSKTKVDTILWHDLQYLQLKTISYIFEDEKKNIYINDNQGRLVILKEENDQIRKVTDIKEIGVIHDYSEDFNNNVIWFASSKGLGKIDPTTFEYNLLNESKDNIPEESFYGIIQDNLGQLWLPGNNGLIRYLPEHQDFHRFGVSDGLLSAVFNKNTSIVASETGEIWLGGKNGVNVFIPEEIEILDLKPTVQLSRFLVNDEEFELDGNINEQTKLTFKHSENTLSFQFVALDYSDPEANQFIYQMEGHDDAPVENGNRNFVRYGNLPSGNYTFKVWATNSDLVLNETPFEMKIRIIPPFYQTWWFYLLSAIAFCSIIYGTFKYRLEQALKVERLRVKISSDLHDDVGGLLTGLAMQTEILELTAKDDVKPKLRRIADLSRSAMSRMRDTVWAIDARKDRLENLLDRMNEHAEETLIPRKIHYVIDTDKLDLTAKLPTDIRQNLYLIYKEAITNVAKHSNGDAVKVSLKRAEGYFEMHIHDNGKVEDKQYKTTGLGLSNMEMRAKQIDATLVRSIENGYQISLKRKPFLMS